MSSKKVALVSGANKSIGFETVRALAQRGMTVYLGSRDEAAGRAAAEQLAAAGDVRAVRLDVTDRASMAAAIRLIGDAHGRLDVLVNNAAIANDGNDAVDVDLAVARAAFDTNVWGVITLTQLVTPLLRAAGQARVVNVSSIAGSLRWLSKFDRPMIKPFAYCLSKTALNGVTVLFADAFKHDGIKVNAANPGAVKSALSHGMGDKTPAEGARVVVQLATLGEDGPSGGFFDENGPLSW